MLKEFFSLFRSFRSRQVFSKKSPLHKIACFGTSLELLYRIKTKKKLEEATEAYPRFIYPESVCFDIGAGYGRQTFLIAKLATKGRVYSFEPEDYSYQVLSNIVKIYRLKNVTIVKKGVYDEETTLELIVPLKKSNKFAPHLSYLAKNCSFDNYGQILEKIETVTIDKYCARNNITKVDFIKCDAEGAEITILKGAKNILAKQRPVIFSEAIETNFSKFNLTFEQIKKFFYELNYLSIVFKDGKFKTEEISKNHCDYFFVPREKELPV